MFKNKRPHAWLFILLLLCFYFNQFVFIDDDDDDDVGTYDYITIILFIFESSVFWSLVIAEMIFQAISAIYFG